MEQSRIVTSSTSQSRIARSWDASVGKSSPPWQSMTACEGGTSVCLSGEQGPLVSPWPRCRRSSLPRRKRTTGSPEEAAWQTATSPGSVAANDLAGGTSAQPEPRTRTTDSAARSMTHLRPITLRSCGGCHLSTRGGTMGWKEAEHGPTQSYRLCDCPWADHRLRRWFWARRRGGRLARDDRRAGPMDRRRRGQERASRGQEALAARWQ